MDISCNGRHCLLVVLHCLYGAVHDVCLLFLAALYVGTFSSSPVLSYRLFPSLYLSVLYAVFVQCSRFVVAGFLSMLCALLACFLFALLNCAGCQWYLFLGSCPCGI